MSLKCLDGSLCRVGLVVAGRDNFDFNTVLLCARDHFLGNFVVHALECSVEPNATETFIITFPSSKQLVIGMVFDRFGINEVRVEIAHNG